MKPGLSELEKVKEMIALEILNRLSAPKRGLGADNTALRESALTPENLADAPGDLGSEWHH